MRLGSLCFFFAPFLLIPACSSGDFAVAPASGGPHDSGEPTDGGGPETPGPDGGGPDAPDPCIADPLAAGFCVHVAIDPEHPGYDTSSGATSLGIDGKGILYVDLYNQQPRTVDPATGKLVSPVASLRYPSADHVGDEASVDEILPPLTGTAPPGTYYVDAYFLDNTTGARNIESELAGDFVLVPGVKNNVPDYPQETLVTGTSKSFDVTIRPVRRIDATLAVLPELHAKALANPAIHGDGAMYFLLYDGDFSGTSTFTVVDYSPYLHCIDLQPGGASPVLSVSFPIHVNGRHKLFALLDDYPGKTPPGESFPRGTLLSVTGTKVVDKVPVVDPGTTSWTSSVDVRFASVVKEYTTSDAPPDVGDAFHCPGSTGK